MGLSCNLPCPSQQLQFQVLALCLSQHTMVIWIITMITWTMFDYVLRYNTDWPENRKQGYNSLNTFN